MTIETTPTTQPDADVFPLDIRIAEACNQPPASVSPEAILARLQTQAPELELRYAMARIRWTSRG